MSVVYCSQNDEEGIHIAKSYASQREKMDLFAYTSSEDPDEHAHAQSDHGFHWSITKLMDTVDFIDERIRSW